MLTLPGAGPITGRDPVVIMRSSDGGVDVLTEDRTYLLPRGSLRDLLFFGNRVFLVDNGEETKDAYALPRRDWISFWIDGASHIIHRSHFVRVVRGDIPVDRLCCVGVR